MITIVLADDHPVVRQGLRAVLATEPAFEVIGEVDDGREVLGLIEHLRPQVLVLDLQLPGLSGLEIARQVTQHLPSTHVLIYSMHADAAYIQEAQQAGALGYIRKDANVAELIQAVHEVASGRYYVHS